MKCQLANDLGPFTGGGSGPNEGWPERRSTPKTPTDGAMTMKPSQLPSGSGKGGADALLYGFYRGLLVDSVAEPRSRRLDHGKAAPIHDRGLWPLDRVLGTAIASVNR